MANEIVTPIGNVQYAWVKNEEIVHTSDGKSISTGKYSITVGFTDDESKQFHEAIDKVWADFLEENGQDKEFKLSSYNSPTKTINDKTYFVFKKNVSITSKETDQPVKLYVPIFDSSNKNCTKKVGSIGRDSQVRIAFSYYPFYMTSSNYGVSLRLHAIQIVKLVPIVSRGEKYGFDVIQNGFVAQDAGDEVEIPF